MPLDLENGGAALVAGTPLPTKTRTVRVVRPFLYGGQVVAAGEEREFLAVFAAELVAGGKAEIVTTAPAAPAAAAPNTKPAKPAKESTHARQ